MIVAVVAMWMVQMTIHQIVHMITMRYRLMSTARTMHMLLSMSRAMMIGSTTIGVHRTHLQTMFVHMITMHVVQMTIMQVVDMTIVFNRRMSAA